MRTALLTSLCLLLAIGQAAGGGLYAVSVSDGPSIIGLEDHGAVVRYIGREGVIVEGDEAFGASVARGELEYHDLGDSDAWEALYLCSPSSRATSYEDLADVLWVDSDGTVLVGATSSAESRLSSRSFMVVRLPGSIDVRAWFDDRPPAHIRGRTRDDERKVRGLVADVIEAVSVDSLMAHVARLSQYPDGTLRSRFIAREECLTEAKPYIVNALSSYLPPGSSIGTQRFAHSYYSCIDDTTLELYPVDNVWGVLEGDGRLGGCYIVCAHYDAIAVRSFPDDSLWFCDNPAPGADDDGTGVATVLEAARVLSNYTFPFDIRFVLLSGEELGLLGSEVYADSAAAVNDTIYGVINVDMTGYKRSPGDRDTCHIVSNAGSGWLGQWVVDTARGDYAEQFEGVDADLIFYTEPMADHVNFWYDGYDAVLAIEHWYPRDRNPYYHTIEDTVGNISPSQFAATTRIVTASIARLVDPDVAFNLAVVDGDVSLSARHLWVGSSTDVMIDVHAYGPMTPVPMTLEAWDGAPGDGELLSSLVLDREMGGGEVIHHEFEWAFRETDVGGHTLTVVVSAEGLDELSLSDNTLALGLRVNDPDRLFVIDHFVYPNPVPTMDKLNFRYELSREAEYVAITVYDLTGQERARLFGVPGPPGSEEGLGASAGWNTVSWHDSDEAAPELPSGLYLYHLEAHAGGAVVDRQSGKFAVAR